MVELHIYYNNRAFQRIYMYILFTKNVTVKMNEVYIQ